ncbi:MULTISPECIES: alpha/beta hydrolase [unclassified Frankia]|uniref:alpha/beta fold hydrolase n=1 Tax=unclassified Frankia TaxID=2632575 RepID=UPI002AD2DFB4|nr:MULTISPECIES: alpha/beta hydrolase [unclassified Frankia]
MATMEINGAGIAYDDSGAGAPPILFVHGWGGNRTNFAPQVAHFATSHRVVALDRRGHGESDKPEQDYTVEGAADDLAAVCRELGLDRAIVVQHSFDRIAFDFASRYPEFVRGLCVLDGPTLAGPGFDEAARQFLTGLESEHWLAAIRGFADELVFAPGTSDDVREQTIAEVTATPRHVLVSTWRHFIAYPSEDALAKITCPLLYIAGSFPADTERLRELCPQLETAEVRGCGHLIMLANPEAVNRILAGFVAHTDPRP